jgi:hypothetical protein
MGDARASRAPAGVARDVADIERGRPNKTRHLTESLTAQVGRPTPQACGSITMARANRGIRVTPRDRPGSADCDAAVTVTTT